MLEHTSSLEEATVLPLQRLDESDPTCVFVCREEPLLKLHQYLDNSHKGSGSFVLICGEAGTGKTLLVKKFAGEAVALGATSVTASFHGVPAHDPYRPFHKIIETLSQSENSSVLNTTSNSQVLSEKNNFDRQEASLYSLQTDFRLAQQRIIQTLIETSRKNMLIIDLRDAHLAPLAAWQFIHFFSENLVESNILLVLTLRQDGQRANSQTVPSYADVLQRMNREGLVNRITLSRLSKKETRQLVHQVFRKTDFSSQFIHFIHQASTGLPARINRLLKLLIEQELVFEEKGIWFDQDNLDKETLVALLNKDEYLPNIEDSWTELNGFHQTLLKFGSFFEENFDHQTLVDILGKPRLVTIKALVTLQQSKFLIEVADGKYQFKYPTLKARIQEKVPLSKQFDIHHQIARAIEYRTDILPADKTTLLAYHFAKANIPAEAFQYLYNAGQLAIKNFAFVKTRELLKKALDFSNIINQGERDEPKIDIYLQLIWLERALGNREKSLEYCTAALNKWSSTKDIPLQTSVLIQQGLTYFQLNEWEKARECFEACFRDDLQNDSFELAMAHYGAGNVFLETSDYQLAEEHYQKSLELVASDSAKILKANLYNNLGIVQNVRGNRLQAIALYSNCVPIYKELGDHFGLARVYTNIGISYAHEKDWKQADQFYSKSLSVTDALGLLPLKSITFLNRVQALIALKKFSQAREYNLKAYRLLKRLSDNLGLAEYYKNQGILEREEDNLDTAKEHLNTAIRMFDTLSNKLGIAESEYELGLLNLTDNAPTEMQACFKRSLENYRALGLTEKVKEIEDKLHLEEQTSLS